jgi:carbonic anhydrase/acetyltransferase-like protein (isoleucine patch superfamily)
MLKIILKNLDPVYPFNEPARDLTIWNKPLWLLHRDVLATYCKEEREFDFGTAIPETDTETIMYKDNLFFDEDLIAQFLRVAKKQGGPCRIAFKLGDLAISTHAIPLQSGIREEDGLYVADLFYYPQGYSKQAESQLTPVVVDTQSQELGYYHVPTYMAWDKGDLVYQVPTLPFLSIENWVHIFLANTAFGIFSKGLRIENKLDTSFPFMMKVFVRSLLERKQFLESSALVQVGKNCQIDPAAIIQGPTIIGDNVTIGPGVVINSCMIGNNVNITQGVQLMVSTIGSGTYLPFRAALFMTTLMENAMVAQNTCLQMCVIGRNSFIGAGNTFTDFNLINQPIRTIHKGQLMDVRQPVLGGGVGHNCRIGSGHIFMPARNVESGVIMYAKEGRTIIMKNVNLEDSDHQPDKETALTK